MPKHSIAAGCSTASGEGYSLHKFPQNKVLYSYAQNEPKPLSAIEVTGMVPRPAQCYALSIFTRNAS